jgi:hypothetical protein
MCKQINRLYLLLFALVPLFVSSNTELPDPTRPANYMVKNTEPVYIEELVTDAKKKPNWKLTAIRISDSDKTAIMNGELVRVGDEVASAKVLEIKPVSVVIDHDDRKLIVRLFKDQVVKDYK